MGWNERQDLEDLQTLSLNVMVALTKLSNAALRLNERRSIKPVGDLYRAANRAWSQIDEQVEAIGILLKNT